MRLVPTRASQAQVAFIDPACTEGYEPADLANKALGGTEASLLRLSRSLQDDFNISLYQNGRERGTQSGALKILPFSIPAASDRPAVFVVINRWKVALKLRKKFPDAPIFLWLHIHPGRHNRKMGPELQAAGITVICVSRTHRDRFASFIGDSARLDIRYIYNPIDDDLCATDARRNRSRLLFASSPHKGLRQVFAQFRHLREHLPELTLAVADPGYLRWDVGPIPNGVIFLGPMTHAALIAEMRKSLCLFYPQTSFAETFGLVLAEANAVGTPALLHRDLGANEEIVHGHGQCIDGNDPAAILSRIKQWRDEFPIIETKGAFRLSAVAREWRALLREASHAGFANLEKAG